MPEQQLAVPGDQGAVEIEQGDARGRSFGDRGRHAVKFPMGKSKIQAFRDFLMTARGKLRFLAGRSAVKLRGNRAVQPPREHQRGDEREPAATPTHLNIDRAASLV
jgi:hypothetical protein